MTETKKPAAPQPQAELSEEQLDAVGGVVAGSLADGRYTLTVLASQVGTSNIKDGTSNTILFGERY